MAKIIQKSNYRVIVTPSRLGSLGAVSVSDKFLYSKQEDRERKYAERCEEIKKQIIEFVGNVKSLDVEYDTEEVCSHCGYNWQEDETGCPVCCDKAIEEFETSKAKTV
jgi:rubrerythrin